jgi:protein TonB
MSSIGYSSIGYEDALETLSMSLEEDLYLAAVHEGYRDLPENGVEHALIRRSQPSGIICGLGFSLAAHTVALVLALWMPSAPPHMQAPSAITVDLIGSLESGGGTGGDREGTNGPLSGDPGEFHPPETAPKWAPAIAPNDPASAEHLPPPPEEKAETEVKKDATEAPPAPQRFTAVKEKKKVSPTRKSKPARASEARARQTASASISDCLPVQYPSTPPGIGPSQGGDNDSGSGDGTGSSGVGAGASSAGGSPGHGGGVPNELDLKQVDQAPSVLKKVEPEFPLEARRLHMGGKVVVKFLVRTDGSVAKASVVKADPEGVFDQSALDAIGKWRFKPGRYKGSDVATWVVLTIQFRFTA